MELEKPKKVYAVKHKMISTRMASRSGGFFTAISDYVLKQEGVVYGCVLSEKFEVEHLRAESESDRNRMRGSKYVQSRLGDTFRLVKNDLEDNRLVLFTGVTCQIVGLKSFLGKEYDKLICMDIVCHGVPSPKIWHDYVEWQVEKDVGLCISIEFRDKKTFGWEPCIETLTFKSDEGENVIHSEIYTRMYFNHNILRPCCYKCPYKSIVHLSDITIGDYWGINKAAPGFNDGKGISLVLVNNKKGINVFDSIKNDLEYRECKIEDSMQMPFVKSVKKPREREHFWEYYSNNSFDALVAKYAKPSWKTGLKRVLGGTSSELEARVYKEKAVVLKMRNDD